MIAVGSSVPLRVIRRIKSHSGLMLAFLAIAFVYFFGIAAEVYVGFGPPKSIVVVFNQVHLSDLLHPQAKLPSHLGVFVVCLAALVAYMLIHSRAVRVVLAFLYSLAPLFFALVWFNFWTGWEGVIGLLYVTLMAPIWTISAVMGRLDGEFYAEGFLAATAIGWWTLMWLLVILRQVYLCLPCDRVQTGISPDLLSILNDRRRSETASN